MTVPTFLAKRGKALVCLFFLAILLLGLCTVTDYGRYWDELSELRIFRMSVMEYAQVLPFLDDLRQALADMGVEPLSQSVEMDHNFSLYYPLAGLACDPALDVNRLSRIWRGYTWAVFTLGLFSLYAICRRLGLSRPLSCVAVLLLLLSPRFFAQGHYNNKDIPLMTLTGLTLWQTLRLRERPTVPRALTFALVAGLCVNTRVIGGAIGALCGLALVVGLWAEGRLTRRVLGVGAFALVCALGCYALFTPALLRDPAAYVSYVLKNALYFSRWNGTMLFLGQEIDLSAGKPPFYYLPVIIGVTTPLLQLALALFGGGITLRASCRMLRALGKRPPASIVRPSAKGPRRAERDFAAVLCLLLWLLPLLCAMAFRVRIYNGWRHFYFLYLPMMASAAWALDWLWQRAKPRPALRRAVALGLCCVLTAQAVLLGGNHPYQYAYYNPLVSRDGIEQRYELDYWNLSVYQALRQLESLAQDQDPIPVACTDQRTRTGYAFATTLMTAEEEARFQLVDYEEKDRAHFYTLANTSYLALSGLELPKDLRPVAVIRAYGADLCAVYAYRPEEVSP